MHSEDKFALWLMMADVVKRWRSMDGAYKIHLYDGSPHEKEIHNIISKACDKLEGFMTTKELPMKAVRERRRLRKNERIRRKAGI